MKGIVRKVSVSQETKEEGSVAVEYALISGLISVVIISAVSDLGITIRNIFQTLADALA